MKTAWEAQLAHELGMVTVTEIWQTDAQKQPVKMIALLANGYPINLPDGIMAEVRRVSAEEAKYLIPLPPSRDRD